MSDQVNTPLALSRKMVDSVRGAQVRTVADFAAGSGQLLRAARFRWRSAELIALDIDERVVRQLRAEEPTWVISKGNFLCGRSRKQCVAIHKARRGVDLVLLNPPFTSRGGSLCEVHMGQETLACSRALAFVITSLPFLSRNGRLVTILPAGSLTSEKDKLAWTILKETFNVSVLASNGHKAFECVAAKTVVVQITARSRIAPAVGQRTRSTEQNHPEVALYRGTLQMHERRNDGGPAEIPLVHSTCLQHGSVDLSRLRVSNARFKISGPALLINRVGEPRIDKMVLYTGHEYFALSDCVIAVKAETAELATLRRSLAKSWRSLRQLYRGTGAQYVTLAGIASFLRKRGLIVRTPRNVNLCVEGEIDRDLLCRWRAVFRQMRCDSEKN